MNRPFAGFSAERSHAILLPMELFTQVLAEVRDLGELKVLLTIFRLAAAKQEPAKGTPRVVSWPELCQDEVLQRGLDTLGGERTSQERLDRALEQAVARGTLLHLVVQQKGHAESCYAINTAANRRLLEQMEHPADLLQDGPPRSASEVRVERPSIFALYEQNIGMVTPILAGELEEAAQQYPAEWIEEAFGEAVAYNRRSWRYVQAILERWEREGRGERADRGERPIDFEKYTRGEYADLFGDG